MKKKNVNSTLFYLAAVLFYVAAIIGFAGIRENTMSFFWLCMGTVFLCLGSRFRQKEQNKENGENKEE